MVRECHPNILTTIYVKVESAENPTNFLKLSLITIPLEVSWIIFHYYTIQYPLEVPGSSFVEAINLDGQRGSCCQPRNKI